MVSKAEITECTTHINEMGKCIIRMYELTKQVPLDLQKVYAKEILDLVDVYYKLIEDLKQKLVHYNQQVDIPDIGIKRLEKSLSLFKQV